MARNRFQECDICGVEVQPEEFERGRAVQVLGKTYCPACAAAAIRHSRTSGTAPDSRTSRPRSEVKDRRRDSRKTTSIAVELSLYLEGGNLFERGKAILANVSLSGALLRALVFSERSFPVVAHTVGIRLLEGGAKDLEILGRPVRVVHGPSSLEIAVEFVETKESQHVALQKII